MTLEELDDGLRKIGVQLDIPEGMEIRNEIIRRYGKYKLNAKSTRCKQCQTSIKGFKNRSNCEGCDMYNLSDDPLQVGLDDINRRSNSIDLFVFIVMFAIPLYEELTGEKNVMENLAKEFRKRWKKEHPADEKSNYL